MSDFTEARSERPWAELQKLSVDELTAYHDELSITTGLGPEYYREEIRYRRQLGVARQMRFLTIVITLLTLVVTVATVYNAVNHAPTPTQAEPQ